jgi:hypothetical protein
MRPIGITPFLLVFLFSGLVSCSTSKQTNNKSSVVVEAKKWSRVDGKIKHSKWMKFEATTLNVLPGFIPESTEDFSIYGGDTENKTISTGYFYTKKVDGRWWVIDPEGFACWHVGVSGIRPGGSERNKSALTKEFETPEKWVVKTSTKITELGFNGAGCWSDVPLIRLSNQDANTPLSYTMIWNFFTGYSKQKKQNNTKGPSFPVFDAEFETYCEEQAKKLEETRNDPNLFGHFSDNELSFSDKTLDEYLAVTDANDLNYKAAIEWLKRKGVSVNSITDSIRNAFLETVSNRYYSVVSGSIKKHDPNHLYLGSRLHGKPKHNKGIIEAAGKYADIISINYYGQWEPARKHFSEWQAWTNKPILITEFYTKGEDSGLANISGAGWTVHTQNDRGIFYENFCLSLLQMNNCVGWHWFRYMDNDPTDKTADPSNNDSNKGIVDNYYQYYSPLTDHMRILNINRYKLIKYFRKKEIIG